MKRIWIPEIKELGWQTSIEFIINTQIVQIFPDKELNLLMESALEHEEYEACEIIKQEIDLRNKIKGDAENLIE